MTPRPGLLRGSKIKNYKGSNALRVTWSPPPGFSSRLFNSGNAVSGSADSSNAADRIDSIGAASLATDNAEPLRLSQVM